MIPLTVPQEDRRIVLRSFWFLISAIVAALVFVPARLAGLPAWTICLGIFLVVGSLALSREHLVRRLYHAWNNRIIRPLSDVVIAIILRICLFIVFAATGRAGSRLRLRAATDTMWGEREINASHTTTWPFVDTQSSDTSDAPKGWIRNYLRWAVRSENAWAIFLIPFFCLLRMVSTEEPTASGANIYTLF